MFPLLKDKTKKIKLLLNLPKLPKYKLHLNKTMKTTKTLSTNPNTTVNYMHEFLLSLPCNPSTFIIPKQTTPQFTSPGCQATLLVSPSLK